ncbi:hypothetical protein MXD62_11135 [Frankia sp. Mgl5]|uniref:hypothetical protein n=1 Tax=Frankia sp. Mgl5 TaxID=2933793 RepID=UPI00200C5EA5|nr:hypothetical protein [Frankia sp. Mgl5]MCK9927716.1 hypothetical protein [Frankia sp. Mgl5]
MTIDVERDLRAALRAVTAEVTARPDTVRLVRERFRLRRRRRRAALAAAVAVLVVAIPTGLGLARSDSDTVEVRPARPSPTASPAAGPTSAPTAGPGSGLGPGRDVGGVGITWIPAGMTFEEDASGAGTGEPTPDTTAYSSSFNAMMGEQMAFVMVTVSWGPVPTLDAVESSMRGVQPARTFARTTVRGRPAVFTRMDPKGEFALVWAEQDGLLIEVAAGTPLTEDELRRVADGLVVGARPTLDPRTEQAVREAVTRAYTMDGPADRALAAVENGPGLAETRSRFLANHPGFAHTLRVTVQDVVLRDPEHAVASFTLNFTDPTILRPFTGQWDEPRSYSTSGKVIHTAGGWKVSRASYCMTILDDCPIETPATPAGGPS